MDTLPKCLLGATLVAVFASACAQGSGSGSLLAACRGATSADAAVALCTKAIEDPGIPEHDRATAYGHRAGAQQASGKPSEAIADANAAVRLAPKDPLLLVNRGSIESAQGHPDAARRDIDAALAIAPDEAYVMGARAMLHNKQGEWAEGHEILKRARKIDPNSFAVLSELCWNGAAGSPDPAGALADCDKAVELFNDANNFNSRGMAYFRAGKYTESIADYDRSIELDPRVGSSWYMRGLAKQAAGVSGAQADIDKGLELEPGVRERYVRVGILPK